MRASAAASRRVVLLEACVVFAAGLAVVAAAYAPRIGAYAPTGDELALLAASRELTPLAWLREGYSRYFVVFPEWTVPYTNFVRPVANAIYHLHLRLFGDRHWIQLLTVNAATHAAVAALVHAAARRLQGATRLGSAALAALAFLGAPFFASPMPVEPAFALDGIVGLLALAAVVAYATGRRAASAAVLLVAAFTKESALPVTAALLAVSAVRRDLRGALGFALVLAAFAAARLWAFGALGGVYAVGGGFSLPFRVVARVPVGYAETRLARSGWTSGESALALAAALGLAANVTLWAGSLAALVRRRREAVAALLAPSAAASQGLTIAAAAAATASFGYVALVGGDPRFGYAGWTLLAVALGGRILGRATRPWVALALVACASGAAAHVASARSARARARDAVESSYTAALLDALRTTSAPLALAVNDLGLGHAASPLVTRFAGVERARLERLNSVDLGGCAPQALSALRASCEERGGAVSLVRVAIPPCARFAFPGAALDRALGGGNGARRGALRYTFPELTRSRTRHGTPTIELGHRLLVEIDPPLAAVCLAPVVRPDGSVAVGPASPGPASP